MSAQPPRILHVSEILPGGTATYIQELWAFQRDQIGEERVRFLLPGPQLEHAPDLPRHRIAGWPRSGRDPGSLRRLGAALSAEVAAFRPDLVHLHGTFAGVVGRALLGLRPRRPKILYCAHGWSFAMDVSPLKKKLYSSLERVLAPGCDAIATISDDERRLAVAAGLPAGKLVTIWNGIAEAPRGGGAARPEEGPLRLLFAGRHDRQKGLDILLDAMALLDGVPVELDVLGEPLGEDGRPLPDGASPPARPGARVNYVGWVPREEVARRMAAADAFVMPSRWEGFGLVAVEAMREGTPVLAANRGALPEIIDHGRSGLIFPLDPEAIAGCLRGLARPQLRAMGMEARRDFEARFTARRMSEEILALYGRLLGTAGRAA
ncbi:glycosyltransferase [Xanthobacter pseudotagetidis]|uniref:glycosyltransferase n=1 Tax=Xanthobacter pseudotagetidis TaxID=3119911 RepID=UPI0037298FEC